MCRRQYLANGFHWAQETVINRCESILYNCTCRISDSTVSEDAEMCRRMLRSNPELLQHLHWQSDALTTRLDLTPHFSVRSSRACGWDTIIVSSLEGPFFHRKQIIRRDVLDIIPLFLQPSVFSFNYIWNHNFLFYLSFPSKQQFIAATPALQIKHGIQIY